MRWEARENVVKEHGGYMMEGDAMFYSGYKTIHPQRS